MSPKYPLQFSESYFTSFSIPEQFLRNLSYYKRLHWSASYFLQQWESNVGTYAAGTIRRFNHINHVQFCSECSIGRIKELLEINPALQLDLSFRKSDGLPAFVLVDFCMADKSNLLKES